MIKEETPFKAHLLVCTNERPTGDKPSCGPCGGAAIHPVLKEAFEEAGLKGIVRVTKTGCLGPCGKGPVVMLYPQGIQFSEVTREDVTAILEEVRSQAGV